jgi:hypothetical protein
LYLFRYLQLKNAEGVLFAEESFDLSIHFKYTSAVSASLVMVQTPQ